jgi:hypothetical protein
MYVYVPDRTIRTFITLLGVQMTCASSAHHQNTQGIDQQQQQKGELRTVNNLPKKGGKYNITL